MVHSSKVSYEAASVTVLNPYNFYVVKFQYYGSEEDGRRQLRIKLLAGSPMQYGTVKHQIVDRAEYDHMHRVGRVPHQTNWAIINDMAGLGTKILQSGAVDRELTSELAGYANKRIRPESTIASTYAGQTVGDTIEV